MIELQVREGGSVRRLLLSTLVATLVISNAMPAQAALRRIGRASSSGEFASAIAQGSVNEPKALFVQVTAAPNQQVDVFWNVLCNRGNAVRLIDGDYTTQTPDKRQIKIPFNRRPDDCDVTALGALDDGGRITVILLARV